MKYNNCYTLFYDIIRLRILWRFNLKKYNSKTNRIDKHRLPNNNNYPGYYIDKNGIIYYGYIYGNLCKSELNK